MTGRKIIVDTYGGAAPHGGGAFSGKDPSKVDRSGGLLLPLRGAQVVAAGLAAPRPRSRSPTRSAWPSPSRVLVDTFGTGDPRAAEAFVSTFDFRPGAIVERLSLLRPIYSQTTNYGHFGKPELPWESQ